MKTQFVFRSVGLLITTVILFGAEAPLQARRENSKAPEGLGDSDWSGIRGAYERHRHAIAANPDGTFQARNPGQAWLTQFDSRGFTVTPDSGGWSWGLELVGGIPPSSQATTDRNRISCRRSENIEEWFLNDTRGLEQGWTIRSKSAAGKPTLSLAVRGSLIPCVSEDRHGVTFRTRDGAAALTYGGLKAWDAENRDVDVRFSTAGDGSRLAILIDDSDAVYPITIDPTAQQAYLKASNTETADSFGCAVAVSGDTAVVGAYREKSNATGVNGNQGNNSLNQAGAAYVFVRDGGGNWSQQAYLKASDTAGFQWFGSSVAISGDTLVIGANGVANAAYVFVRSGTTWTQQALLKAFNPTAGYFGVSVSISGNTVVVGDKLEDSAATGVGGNQFDTSASDAGAAFVFVRSGTSWSQQAYLKASNTQANDNFGASVSVAGDTVVVGAAQEASSATGVGGNQSDNGALGAGAAYVFVRSGTAWSQQAYLKASNTQTDDLFGASVSVAGDTVVVGAPQEDSIATGVNGNQADENRPNSGAAYVFQRSGTAWSQQAYLKATISYGGEVFGGSVSISGDILLVGTAGEDSAATGVNGNDPGNATDSGAAYVFSRSGTAWGHWLYLKASNTGSGDGFGGSVSVSGSTVIAGAAGERSNATGVNGDQSNNSLTSAGAAYVFALGTPPVVLPFVITACSLTGSDFTIHFTGAAGVTDWRVMGSGDLVSFPDDRTAGSSITETSPGIYEVVVDLSDAPAKYFLRIER